MRKAGIPAIMKLRRKPGTYMTIHLKPELEALIQKDVERGHYQSVGEFVERAVHMLHEEEALLA